MGIDSGNCLTVLDDLNNPVEQRDSKGAIILHTYDVLNRPRELWASDGTGQPLTLRERIDYGDAGDPSQPAAERTANRAANRLGKPYRHYDEAGLLTFEQYDFKGNVLEKTRQVIADVPILAVTPFRVDWARSDAMSLLERF